MAAKQSIAITEATHTPQSTTESPAWSDRSRPPSPLKDKLIYFDIAVYDCNDPDAPARMEVLRAGKPYLLTVTCNKYRPLNRKNVTLQKTPLAGAFSLLLSARYDVSTDAPITPPKTEKSFPGIFEDVAEYEFFLPPDLPTGNLTLSLEVKTSLRKYPSEVARYTLPVQGQQHAPLSEIFTVSQINQHLPQQTAILLVETATRQTELKQLIRLRGWSETGLQLDKTALMKTIVSIEQLQDYRQKQNEAQLDPTAILKRLTNFSRHTPLELLHWLNQLFATYQEQLNLIIVDLTERETPWELLELQPEQYLGASVRVVRWLPTQYFMEKRALSIQPEQHTGPVLSYLDAQLGPENIQLEQDALQRLAGRSFPSLSALRKRLHDSLEDVGLIYIGCHGTDGQHLLQEDVPELSSIMLEGIYKSAIPQPTVFINACASARTIKARPDDNSNFVETFLAYGAAGFIGPLARVGIQNAAIIAHLILLAALEPGGVQVAELLRTLRKEVMDQLRQNTFVLSHDHYLALDLFMYVYYGNPLTHLQLHQRKEPGA